MSAVLTGSDGQEKREPSGTGSQQDSAAPSGVIRLYIFDSKMLAFYCQIGRSAVRGLVLTDRRDNDRFRRADCPRSKTTQWPHLRWFGRQRRALNPSRQPQYRCL